MMKWMHSRLFATVTAAVCALLTETAWAQHTANVPYVKVPVIEEYEAVSASIDRAGKKLLALMNDESAAPANRVAAMGALGRLRFSSAERPLLENLLFTQGTVTRPGPLVCFPAARALTNYGRDLYEAAWAAVDQERPDDYLYVLAVTFAVMDGEEVALIRVQDYIDQPGATPRQLENFRKIASYLRNTDFTDPTTWPRRGNPNPTD
jgi:hypothetical protein